MNRLGKNFTTIRFKALAIISPVELDLGCFGWLNPSKFVQSLNGEWFVPIKDELGQHFFTRTDGKLPGEMLSKRNKGVGNPGDSRFG